MVLYWFEIDNVTSRSTLQPTVVTVGHNASTYVQVTRLISNQSTYILE